MDYQVWTKGEYDESWYKEDCGDLGAAKRELLISSKKGLTSILTVEVPFELQLKIGEPGAEPKTQMGRDKKKAVEAKLEEMSSETDKDKAEQDQNTGS